MIVSAVDLKRLTLQIDGAGMEEKLRLLMKEDREERMRLSKARVKNWDNTISGQRRKKLEARNERMAAEEAERINSDIQYALEESKRRKDSIDRAKRLQYNNQDAVRAFHSRVLLYQVLKVRLVMEYEERDKQIEIKKERVQIQDAAENCFNQEYKNRFSKLAEEDAKHQIETRKRQVALSREQQLQVSERHRKLQDEKVAELVEAKHLAALDEEYRESLKREQERKRLNCLSLRDQLLEMKRDLKEREDAEKRLLAEEEKRIEAWITRKSRQNQMKRQVEQKWFNDAIQLRERLCEVQVKINNDADARIEEHMRLAMERKEIEEKNQEAEREEKKKRQQRELRDYFQHYLQESELKQKEQKLLEQQELEYYNRTRDIVLREQKEAKARALREGKEMQAFHMMQMQHVHAKKKEERENRLSYDKSSVAKVETEAIRWSKMSYREMRMFCEKMRALRYPKLISMDSFRTPNFDLVADILHWLVKRYDPKFEISDDVSTEQDRVIFIKSIAMFLAPKAQIRLNTKKLYMADGYAVKELLKLATVLYDATVQVEHMEDDPVAHTPLDISGKITQLKTCRMLASDITEQGSKLHDSLGKELNIRDIRNAVISRPFELKVMEVAVHDAIRSLNDQIQEMKIGLENLAADETNLMAKIEKRRQEFDRAEKRLKSLQGVRPAYMDDYEKIETELVRLYETYMEKFKNLAYLEQQLDEHNKMEQDKFEETEVLLKRMQNRLREEEMRLLRGEKDMHGGMKSSLYGGSNASRPKRPHGRRHTAGLSTDDTDSESGESDDEGVSLGSDISHDDMLIGDDILDNDTLRKTGGSRMSNGKAMAAGAKARIDTDGSSDLEIGNGDDGHEEISNADDDDNGGIAGDSDNDNDF
ncbi:Clusterin-associated protein 1 [Phlyctochytrium bullatum]|nr:Clusterin-associated protein 1 [Phlyctochytrium bullatum]